jgi:hypothetical protein
MQAPNYDMMKRTYSLFTNEQLEHLAIKIDELTSDARNALQYELQQRGLEVQVASAEPVRSVARSASNSQYPRTCRWNRLWPVITNEEEAKKAAKSGAYVAALIAVLNFLVSLVAIITKEPFLGMDGWGLVDALLFAVIAWRLFKFSFPWAVVGLLLYFAEIYSRWTTVGPTKSGGIVTTGLIVLAFIACVRGTLFLSSERQSSEAGLGVRGGLDNSVNSSLPLARFRSRAFVVAATLCLGCLTTIAYHRVQVIHKEALIAQLAKANDERVALQIRDDFAVLMKDYDARDWSGVRSELLSREPYLIDLKAQNEKAQRRLLARRNATPDVDDNCQRMELDEGEPALEAVMTAQNDLLSFAKQTIKLTANKESVLQLLAIQDTSAWNKWNEYITDQHSHGCDK